MKYLVTGSKGPGFKTAEEVAPVLEAMVLPSLEALIKLEAEGVILGGGLPVGGRAFIFVLEASTNDEVDRLLRRLPMWGALDWEVCALQTFIGRAEEEREALKKSKAQK